MVNINKLKGVIVEKGLTQSEMAKKMGISDRTFYNKMKRRVFNSDEIIEIASILAIGEKDVIAIFLTKMLRDK